MSFKLKEEYDINISKKTENEVNKNKSRVFTEQNSNYLNKNTNDLFDFKQINNETNQENLNKSDNSGIINNLTKKNEIFKNLRNKTDFLSNNNFSMNNDNNINISNTKHSKAGSINFYINELRSHPIINFFNRNCTINCKFLTIVINTIFSFSIFILNIDDVKNKEKYYINYISIFLLEFFNSLYIEITYFIFRYISSLSKYKIVLILNIMIIIFTINLIVNFIIKNESKFYRIINLFYSLTMIASNLITINIICKYEKKKQNNLQNIEDIINFSEINKDKDKKHIGFSSAVYDKLKDITKKRDEIELIEEENQNDIKKEKNNNNNIKNVDIK